MQTLEPQNLTNWELNIEGEINLLKGIFNGIGQVFFLDNIISGIIIFLAVFLAGKKLGFYAVIGNLVAIIYCLFFRRGTFFNRFRALWI